MQRAGRMKRELELFQNSPPHGITCFLKDNSISSLEAQILGPEGSPYEKGLFKLDIHLPERYPFEPPKVNFITPIYHPNIDNAGRICLDSLKMPPKGAWKPALNISAVLTSIQLLMSEPNPEDPLMTDIANEFKYKRTEFNQHAEEYTLKHAADKLTLTSRIVNDKQVSSESENESTGSDSESDQDNTTNNIDKTEKRDKKRTSEENSSILQENVKRLKNQ